jgi:hypothetical protein
VWVVYKLTTNHLEEPSTGSLRCSLVLLGVVESWVNELAIVVLGEEVGSHGVGHSEEVLHVHRVADVGVQVVLEVLEHVHVLANVVISSNSWEREGLVVEIPGLNLEFWKVLGSLLLEGTIDVKNVSPVSWVKSSGEHFHLVLELTNGLIEVNAWSTGLNEGLVSNWGVFNLGGSSDTNQKKESGIFHLYSQNKNDEN